MRFALSTASLATTLLLSSSLTSVLALPGPQAWCVVFNIPCFAPPPPSDCQYCGSWAGHDAVLDCDSHGLIKYCGGGGCHSAPGPNINC